MDNKKIKLSLSCVFNNTFGCIKKIPWILGRNAFVVILFLVILDILFGVLIFYNYIFLVRTSQPRITESPSAFKTNVYQEVLREWETREQNLQNIKPPANF